MSGSEFTPDLTEPVEAAARRYHEEWLRKQRIPSALPPWDELDAMAKHYVREAALPYVAGAAPVIVAQTLRWAADKTDEGDD